MPIVLAGAEPGFLEREFIYGVRFNILPKYPMKMKKLGLTETKLFHFHRIFINGGGGGGVGGGGGGG